MKSRLLPERMCKIFKKRIILFSDPLFTPGRGLHFPEQAGFFVEKKATEMKNVETDFRAFARFLETAPVLPDFPATCKLLHIRPGVLDDYLLRELGVCGEALMMRF